MRQYLSAFDPEFSQAVFLSYINMTQVRRHTLIREEDKKVDCHVKNGIIITYSEAPVKTYVVNNLLAMQLAKKERRNLNDPAHFWEKIAVAKEGEKTGIEYFLDEDRVM